MQLLDLRRQQFVLINNRPVLVDLDDVVEVEGSTELATVRRLYDAFVADFLSYGAPEAVLPLLDNLKSTILNGNATFASILRLFDRLSLAEHSNTDPKLERITFFLHNNNTNTILLHNDNGNKSDSAVPVENIVNSGRVLSQNASFLDCVSKNLLICDT